MLSRLAYSGNKTGSRQDPGYRDKITELENWKFTSKIGNSHYLGIARIRKSGSLKEFSVFPEFSMLRSV
jgi:hypothetical protein